MSLKEFLGLMLLTFGIVGVFSGIGAISRDYPMGWLILVAGVAFAAGAYRVLRPAPSSPESEGETESEKAAE